jgi:hypothetical protein
MNGDNNRLVQLRNFSSFQKRKEKFALAKQLHSFSSTSQLMTNANREKIDATSTSLNSSAPELSFHPNTTTEDDVESKNHLIVRKLSLEYYEMLIMKVKRNDRIE